MRPSLLGVLLYYAILCYVRELLERVCWWQEKEFAGTCTGSSTHWSPFSTSKNSLLHHAERRESGETPRPAPRLSPYGMTGAAIM